MKKSLFFVLAAVAALSVGCTDKSDPNSNLPGNSFTSFKFKAVDNAKFLKEDAVGTIDGSAINVVVPFGTRVDSLIADFSTKSADCMVTVELAGSDSLQISGINANDFTNIVEYLVTLDGKSNAYNVTVKNPDPVNTWSQVFKHEVKAANMQMDFDKAGKPVLATLINKESSRGPLVCLTDNNGAAVVDTVVSATVNPCQYLGFGISPAGTKVVYTNDYAATSANRKGNIYTSNGSKWAKADVLIDYSNGMYGPKVGFYNEDAFVMTSNNAAGAVAKRYINITSCKNGSWSTGAGLCNRAVNSYYPIMASNGKNLFAFVTDMGSPTGLSLYKYDGSAWSEVVKFSSTDPGLADIVYPTNAAQDMVVTEDETVYFAFGAAKDPRVVRVAQLKNGRFTLIGSPIAVGGDIAARYCRIAIAKDGTIYLAYRSGANSTPYTLNVTSLNKDTQDWNTPSQLAAGVDNINLGFNAAGECYVACSTDEVKGEVTTPASVVLFKLDK